MISWQANPIGEVDAARMGYSAAIGTYVKVAGSLLIDLYANYSVCEFSSDDFEINIGGFGEGWGSPLNSEPE